MRNIIGIKWPNRIKNKNLYKITDTKPISVEITKTINRDITRTKRIYPDFAIQKMTMEINLHNNRCKAKNRRQWKKAVKQVVDGLIPTFQCNTTVDIQYQPMEIQVN